MPQETNNREAWFIRSAKDSIHNAIPIAYFSILTLAYAMLILELLIKRAIEKRGAVA